MSAAIDDRRNSLDLPGAVEAARTAYAAKRPLSAALHEQALEVLGGGNTRSVIAYSPFPTSMTRGEDCRLWDLDGHEYLDLCGEYTAGLFGHSEPRIHAVLHDVLRRGINFASVGPGEERLARLLCGRFPSLERVRFTNSGTEANLMALTAARALTGRPKVMAFRGGYHGGVLTFPFAGSSPAALPLPFVMADYNDAAGAAAAAREHGAELAAIIVEPMLGSGGCIPAEPAFLAALRAVADETGALLIFDEVMTSRHAAGGMQARLGITPDMTTLGKYIAGGMSFGAFGGRADVMAQFGGKLAHAGTFNNNVLSMNAGVVAMGEIFTAEAAEALYRRGEALCARLNGLAEAAGVPLGFTGIGSMLTVHFRRPAPGRPYASTPGEEQLRELFFFDMLEAGIYLARRGMVALSLPVGEAELDRFAAAVAGFIEHRAELLRAGGVGG
ncbi:aminotransferase class III-fold pyridoxal phosphate-dependent enzyme [Belnapia sp. T18]|uniref:Aminotransferase class III-fold pyridoxal phosphate-dependent enzyme n=1 Tax=Belnapia arida TaxID=2804533 RepID=A0ABS1U5N1_9PROT|nr:aminotransferase class III-fold pyridoxal phosphate-dependent enzyme [Belnapia arida]MBL6079996.1 aminotransferase class III-fold pyridoxal phosphate-dependent enzyme [Belnapia arida]